MENLEETIVGLEQDLIQYKANQSTRADSANWYKLVINLDNPETGNNANSYYYTIRLTPETKGRGDLVVNPYLCRGYVLTTNSGTGYSQSQIDYVGEIHLDFTDPLQFVATVRGLRLSWGSSTSYSVKQSPYVIVYSNYPLLLTEKTKTAYQASA